MNYIQLLNHQILHQQLILQFVNVSLNIRQQLDYSHSFYRLQNNHFQLELDSRKGPLWPHHQSVQQPVLVHQKYWYLQNS